MTSHDRLFDTFEDFLGRCVGMTEAQEIDRMLDLELSLTQTKSIFVLRQAEAPLPITSIASKLGLSAPTAGRTVDALVRAGLVERHEAPDDRRVKLVSLSKAGRDVADQHFEAHRSTFRDIFARLSDAEADRLAAALQPLIAAVTASTPEQEIPA